MICSLRWSCGPGEVMNMSTSLRVTLAVLILTAVCVAGAPAQSERDAFSEMLSRLGITGMDMEHRRPRLTGPPGLLNYLIRCNRQMRRHCRRVNRTGQCSCNDNFFRHF